MKSAVAAAAGLLAVANAYQPRNFHWRRDNETASAAPVDGFTTLTVEVTEVATVTSCKPTVTNCAAVSSSLPEEDLEVVIVTNTVVLTETVCPISEVEEIESSVIQEHETGSLTGSTRTEPASAPFPSLTVPVDIPLSTNFPATTTSEALPVDGEELTTEVQDVETTATLTLTLGRGESASVVETVVTSTFQTTVVKTITACPGGCDGSEEAEATGKVPGSGNGSDDEEDEFTTTTTATTTGYTTVTVQPEETTQENSPEASNPPAGSDDESTGTCPGSGEQCLCPSAVTVTIPASTVYVTIGGDAKPTDAPEGSNPPAGSDEEVDDNKPVEGEEVDDEEDVDEDDCPVEEEEDDDEDDCDEVEDDVVTVSATVTVEPVPYPTGGNNGTQPSGAPAPTGYPVRVR